MNWIFLVFAFLIGISNAVQSGVNTQLRESINNPILAAMTSFFVGLVVLSIAFACFNQILFLPSPTSNRSHGRGSWAVSLVHSM